MDILLQDLRFAIRTLVKAPLISGLAIVCLALGIGANGAMFSVFDGVLVKPFPFTDPDRIVVLTETNQRSGIDDGAMSYPAFRDLRDGARTLTNVAAWTGRTLSFRDGSADAVRYAGMVISWNLFHLLGVPPALGRDFRPDDDRPGAPGTVILADSVWRAHYHADPSVIGRTIMINDAPHTVIGVMPPRFAFPATTEAWIPIAPSHDASTRADRVIRVYARLVPGATFEQAREELREFGSRLASQHAENRGWSADALTLSDDLLPEEPKLVTTAAMGAVSLVLLIACANVANLLLARATSRQREIAVRIAVGASRGRVLRQLLTESVVLGAAAVPFGIVLTIVGVRLVDAGIPSPDLLPYYVTWTVDTRVVLWVVAVALGSGVLFGLAPALQTLKTSLVESLKEGSRGGVGGQRGRFRSAIVVAEVALSLVLLVGAALFVRSFLNLQTANAGFDTAPLLVLRIYMPGERYTPAGEIARRVEDLVRRIESVPGVQSAGASNYLPLASGGDGGGVIVDGRPSTPGEEPQIGWAAITPHFFRTLDIRVREGRDFTDAEGHSRARVALVNATMAARFWPGKTAVGQRFRLADEAARDWFTVIGIVPDIARGFVGSRPLPYAFVPHPFGETRNTGVMIRAAGAPASVLPLVRDEVRASDAAMPIFQVMTMDEARERGYWQYRLFSWMFSIFGAIALVLAAVGVYGVLAYSVSQRSHEIGVRMALGARGSDVVRMIAAYGLRLVLVGIVIGAVGAAGITQGLRPILFNVSAIDPLSYAGVALFLVGVSIAAAWLPARRATRVDPIVALRSE